MIILTSECPERLLRLGAEGPREDVEQSQFGEVPSAAYARIIVIPEAGG